MRRLRLPETRRQPTLDGKILLKRAQTANNATIPPPRLQHTRLNTKTLNYQTIPPLRQLGNKNNIKKI